MQIQAAPKALIPFLTAVAVFMLPDLSAAAGEIRFWEMRKGCSWTTEFSNGNTWESSYVGRRGGNYVVTTREKFGNKSLVNTTEYNDRGLMTRRVWNGNKWETFEPFSCFGVIGECTSTYRNADGVVSRNSSRTTKIGEKTYRVETNSDQAGNFETDTVERTHFGLALSSKNKNFWAKLTELRNCNVPLS